MKRKMLICLMLILTVVSAFSVKVSPVRFDLSVSRGSSKEFTLNILGSKGLHSQDLIIYPSDLSMDRRGALSFDLTKGRNSAVKWIKLGISKLSLLEEQTKDIKFKVSIPSNVAPGEYYGVIMVEPEQFVNVKDKKEPVTLKLKTRVAIVVILDIPGRVYEKKGEITGLNAFPSEKLVKITSSFKNTGNIHLDVTASATIRSADGKINFSKFNLRALSSSKIEAFMFPDGTRDFEGVLNRQLPEGDYLADVSYNYGYDFKKANKTIKFSIKRKGMINEKNAEFLGLESKELKLSIPIGATRTQTIKVTNKDYRPIGVAVESNDWIQIKPKTFSLKPGEVKNIQAVISVSEYKEAIKKASIIFRPDRGKASVIAVSVIKPGTPNLKELLKASIKPETNTGDESVKEGKVEKKLEKQEPVINKQSEPAKNDSSLNDSVVLKNKAIDKGIVKKDSTGKMENGNALSKLLEVNNIKFVALGLIGIVIIILLLRKKKNGNDAKN
jgi:hypothetical protein